jgi:hypothetical protein
MKKNLLKRKLVMEIDKLPADDLPQVLDLVGKLNTKRKGLRPSPLPQEKRDPAKNPLRRLIGIADVEPFAHRIDEDLYGKHG